MTRKKKNGRKRGISNYIGGGGRRYIGCLGIGDRIVRFRGSKNQVWDFGQAGSADSGCFCYRKVPQSVEDLCFVFCKKLLGRMMWPAG